MRTEQTIRRVLDGVPARACWHEPMTRHTTLRVGGPASCLVYPDGREALARLMEQARRLRVPVIPVGAGSNLLVRDGGIPGIVVKLTRWTRITRLNDRLLALEAGVPLLTAVRWAMKVGLGGLEFAAGIPGTLGGAVVMNAGTPEGEMADIMERVTVLTPEGRVREVSRPRLTFGYRSSRLPEGIVLGAVLRLVKRSPKQVQRRLMQVLARRQETQPLDLPNAGSIFKNPPQGFAGRLIEAAGLKGYRVGNAEVSTLHANFIVNRGGATASEILRLIHRIRQRVLAVHGVELDPEIQLVGRTR